MPSKNKKNIDIIPPSFSVVPQKNFVGKAAERRTSQKKSSSFFLMIFLTVLLVGVAAYFFVPQKAEIIIWPRIETVSFNLTSEISGRFIPDQELSPEKFYSFGTEEIESNAEGTIRIYNDFNLDQTLIAETRFWCRGEEELEFKIKERVNVPAGSHLDVKVVASSPGDKFNIPPCKVFSVPGLAGTPRYTAVYGESFSAMHGGETFTRALVVEKKELENISREYVLSQVSQDQRIKEGSLEVDCSSYSADLNERKISLNLKVTVRIYTTVDHDLFKKAVRRADSEEIKGIIADFPEIEKVQLRLWPFWAVRVPEDITSIDTKLNI